MSDESSNTGTEQEQKPRKPGTFVKGDARINRKGRPKSFDQLRALAQKISHEPIQQGATMTVAEAILRTMAKENPARFVEIAFGKVPDETVITGDEEKPITLKIVRVDKRSADEDQ